VLDFFLSKTLHFGAEFASSREQGQSNTLRITQEKLRTAEEEAKRFRDDLMSEKESHYKRMQDGEQERI